MIIWLNGAFGAGKTQTAYALRRRLPGSYVYDPENAGYFIRKNLPPDLHLADFQDHPLWRTITADMLADLADRHPGHIIVPMTIVNRAYYDEIIGVLSRRYEVKHIILCAGRETLLKRLRTRLESKDGWAARQIDRCISAFDRDIPGEKLHTDTLTIDQAAQGVAALCGLTLAPDRRGPLRKALDRAVTQIRHIR